MVWRRVLVAVLLLGTNAVMMADYAANDRAHSPYPSIGDVAVADGSHVGERVYSWSVVEKVTDEGFVVTHGDRRITVLADTDDLAAGDHVQVYGVVRPGDRIEAERVVISPRRNRVYMLAVSVLGLVLTVGAFFREWTVDLGHLVVRHRGGRAPDTPVEGRD